MVRALRLAPIRRAAACITPIPSPSDPSRLEPVEQPGAPIGHGEPEPRADREGAAGPPVTGVLERVQRRLAHGDRDLRRHRARHRDGRRGRLAGDGAVEAERLAPPGGQVVEQCRHRERPVPGPSPSRPPIWPPIWPPDAAVEAGDPVEPRLGRQQREARRLVGRPAALRLEEGGGELEAVGDAVVRLPACLLRAPEPRPRGLELGEEAGVGVEAVDLRGRGR